MIQNVGIIMTHSESNPKIGYNIERQYAMAL